VAIPVAIGKGVFGGYSSRCSLGYPVGLSRRSSVPANSFNLSIGSFHNTPADDLLEELNEDNDFDDFEGLGHRAAVGGLRKEVVLTRIGSFLYRDLMWRG
jgi:hypothetical protein